MGVEPTNIGGERSLDRPRLRRSHRFNEAAAFAAGQPGVNTTTGLAGVGFNEAAAFAAGQLSA